LRPLTDNRPKALVDIGGENILSRALRLLTQHGVKRVVLATGYREDAIKNALENSPLPVALCHNSQFERTQNAVSLALCRAALEGESFFKLDGDVVFEQEVLERLERAPAELAVAVDGVRKVDAEAMKVAVHLGRIRAFGKALPLAECSGETIGVERVSASASRPLFDALDGAHRAGRTDLYYEDVYSELVEAGLVEAAAVEVGDLPWTEVDDFDDLERARRMTSVVRSR
jgi:L-glutamine-phosphate cytidylyltransferase